MLNDRHSQYLSDRGITDPDIISSRGYRTAVHPRELLALGFSKIQSAHVPGLLLPVHNLAGKESGVEYRADNPRVKGDKPVKFDRPFGQQTCLNAPPTMAGSLRSGEFGDTLIIVEGVTRSDALAQRNVASVAIMGIYGWKASRGKGTAVTSDLHEIPLQGRRVTVIPDGDATSKPAVNRGVRELGDALLRRGAASVQVAVVPDGQGLDDWLAAGHDVSEIASLCIPLSSLCVVTQPVRGVEDLRHRDESLPGTSDRELAEHWLDTGAHTAYVQSRSTWVSYNGRVWQNDPSGNVSRSGLSTLLADVGDKYLSAGEGQSAAEHKAARDTHHNLKSFAKLKAVHGVAASMLRAHATEESFDSDPWLFNVANGTVDLRSGALRPHSPRDKLRGISPTAYNPSATAPTFLKFLAEVLPDREVRDYLQMLMGCALVGEPIHHILPVLVGKGRNGKGTLVKAITKTLGTDYAGPVDKSLLISSRFESHPTKLMALKGKRLVHAAETDEGDKFAAASLKTLTGGDDISARGMREDQQTFSASHSMLLMTNSLPEVDALDDALWARLKLINFTESFEGREDLLLTSKLYGEREGILLWLMHGLGRYLQEGLLPDPHGVTMGTLGWKMDSNSALAFANERLVRGSGRIPGSELAAGYVEWCGKLDVEPLRGRAMGAALRTFGAEQLRSNGKSLWTGVRWGTEGRGSADKVRGVQNECRSEDHENPVFSQVTVVKSVAGADSADNPAVNPVEIADNKFDAVPAPVCSEQEKICTAALSALPPHLTCDDAAKILPDVSALSYDEAWAELFPDGGMSHMKPRRTGVVRYEPQTPDTHDGPLDAHTDEVLYDLTTGAVVRDDASLSTTPYMSGDELWDIVCPGVPRPAVRPFDGHDLRHSEGVESQLPYPPHTW